MIYSAYLLPYSQASKRMTPKGKIESYSIDLWRVFVKERKTEDSSQFVTKTRVASTYKEARKILSDYAQHYEFKEVVLFALNDPTTVELVINDENDELYVFLKYND